MFSRFAVVLLNLPSDRSLVSFFFTDTAPAVFSTLSLHDALPISGDGARRPRVVCCRARVSAVGEDGLHPRQIHRSEEHTSELQSRFDLVCRLLLEKKKKKIHTTTLQPSYCIHSIIHILF